jgi:hypothetical protein
MTAKPPYQVSQAHMRVCKMHVVGHEMVMSESYISIYGLDTTGAIYTLSGRTRCSHIHMRQGDLALVLLIGG